jgi:hypothetical protein
MLYGWKQRPQIDIVAERGQLLRCVHGHSLLSQAPCRVLQSEE